MNAAVGDCFAGGRECSSIEHILPILSADMSI
jgi:hypothetical protein